MDPWHYWLIGAFVLCILEMFTGDLVLLGFGIAAAGASIASSTGADKVGQLSTFGAVSVVFLVVVRPFAKRHLYKSSDPRKTNAAALIGQRATVVDEIPGGQDIGRVKLGGEEWRAVSVDGAAFPSGSTVSVTRVEGATLVVSPVN